MKKKKKSARKFVARVQAKLVFAAMLTNVSAQRAVVSLCATQTYAAAAHNCVTFCARRMRRHCRSLTSCACAWKSQAAKQGSKKQTLASLLLAALHCYTTYSVLHVLKTLQFLLPPFFLRNNSHTQIMCICIHFSIRICICRPRVVAFALHSTAMQIQLKTQC